MDRYSDELDRYINECVREREGGRRRKRNRGGEKEKER